MANTQSSQAFYSLTIEPSTAATAACVCNVIPGAKQQDQQIFEARGQRLYLHRILENADRTEVKVSTFLDQDVFGIVRGVSAFRIPGTSTGESSLSLMSFRMR
jgi:splicing factor 3B subunit 3